MLKLDFQRAVCSASLRWLLTPRLPGGICSSSPTNTTPSPPSAKRTPPVTSGVALRVRRASSPSSPRGACRSLRSALGSDEGWRTLMQCSRTKVSATSDEFTARTAAELCGRADRLKARYSLTEGGQDAHIFPCSQASPRLGTASARARPTCWNRTTCSNRGSLRSLPHAQAIVLPYDGLNPLPARYCYLTALPRRADELLRSRDEGDAMSSLDRILPFLKPIEDLLVDPTSPR